MSNFTKIQQGILELSPGSYQRLCSDYYARLNNITEIHDIGSKEGTEKTTIGVPDSYVFNPDKTFTLLMYGTVTRNSINKIKADIRDAHNSYKTGILVNKIKKIVCFHVCTNINPGKYDEIINMYNDVIIELIDIDTMAHTINERFNSLAVEYFQLPVDTNQISDINDFTQKYDRYSINSPLSLEFVGRDEKEEIIKLIKNSQKLTLITGKAGVGKTRIALEICKELSEDYCCLCIRSNSNAIYEDIKNNIEIDKKYLIFVDDINNLHNLKSFLDLVVTSDKEIKVLGTVREYVLNNILSNIKDYTNPQIFKLNELNDNIIVDILKKNYNIQNEVWQKNILNISNGNPRIAIMTANALLNGKSNSFNNISEVFKEYYDRIIYENKLSKSDIKTLFYLSLLSPLSINNKFIKKLLKDNCIDSIDVFNHLNQLELIDFFNEEAIKICDQNFSNYIIYKYLIDQKSVTISKLLEELYPMFRTKFIEAINMLCEIFYSEDNFEYIKTNILKLWESKYFSDDKFLVAFHNLDISKSLMIIKSKIDNMDKQELETKIKFDRNVNENDWIIDILSDIHEPCYYKISFQLLLEYLEKNPNLYNLIENAILKYWIKADKELNLEMEYFIIEELYDKIATNNEYFDIYIHIIEQSIKKCLETQYKFTEQGKNNRELNIINYTLNYFPKLCMYRNNIFEIMINLLNKIPNLKYLFIDYSIWPLHEGQIEILKSDINYLDKNLFNQWTIPSLDEWKIIDFIKNICNKYNVDIPNSFTSLEESEDYQLLKYFEEYDFDNKNLNLKNIIDGLSEIKCKKIFYVLSEIKKYKIKVCDWRISRNLNLMFEIIINYDINDFENIFLTYLDYGCPFVSNPLYFMKIKDSKIIKRILNKIMECEFDFKYNMLLFILEYTKENIKNMYIIKNFLNYQKNMNRKYSFNIKTILNYNKYDSNLLNLYTEQVLKEEDLNVVEYYTTMDKDFIKIKEIYDSFEDKSLLEKLYIKAIPCETDYQFYLGYLLVKNNSNFVIDILNSNFDHLKIIDQIANHLWIDEDYMNIISNVYEIIKNKKLGCFSLRYLFNTNKYDERQRTWVESYILQNLDNNDNLKYIFRAIDSKKLSKRKELIVFLLKNSKNEKIIDEINLFPMSEFWSGSRLPQMDKKIDYLEEIKKIIENEQKVKYLYAINYLNKCISNIKKEKRNVEIEEYLDGYIY